MPDMLPRELRHDRDLPIARREYSSRDEALGSMVNSWVPGIAVVEEKTLTKGTSMGDGELLGVDER